MFKKFFTNKQFLYSTFNSCSQQRGKKFAINYQNLFYSQSYQSNSILFNKNKNYFSNDNKTNVNDDQDVNSKTEYYLSGVFLNALLIALGYRSYSHFYKKDQNFEGKEIIDKFIEDNSKNSQLSQALEIDRLSESLSIQQLLYLQSKIGESDFLLLSMIQSTIGYKLVNSKYEKDCQGYFQKSLNNIKKVIDQYNQLKSTENLTADKKITCRQLANLIILTLSKIMKYKKNDDERLFALSQAINFIEQFPEEFITNHFISYTFALQQVAQDQFFKQNYQDSFLNSSKVFYLYKNKNDVEKETYTYLQNLNCLAGNLLQLQKWGSYPGFQEEYLKCLYKMKKLMKTDFRVISVYLDAIIFNAELFLKINKKQNLQGLELLKQDEYFEAFKQLYAVKDVDTFCNVSCQQFQNNLNNHLQYLEDFEQSQNPNRQKKIFSVFF